MQKRRVGHAVVEQIAADRGKPDDVGSRFWAEEEIRALGHFMFTQIRNDELLVAQLVSTFYASSEDRVTLCGVAANDEHESGVFNVPDGARVSAITYGSKQTLCCGRLAVP